MTNRKILKLFNSKPTSDGDGVKIRRVATNGDIGALDPFLLFDEIASDDAADYIGGFPSHPHRGFETVTYMLEGAFTHRDHMGNEGHLRTGGVQWMTAGKGVIHSEMPEQEEGRLHGFQIWVNLPAKDKMQPARYQEFDPEQVPQVSLSEGGLVRVIAGSLLGVEGPVKEVATNPSYFDIRLSANTAIDIPTLQEHNAIAYVYKGQLQVDGQSIDQGQLAQFSNGEQVTITAQEDAGLLFLSAAPINEPIANYGPFVMNTRAEIEQAISDYRAGVLTD
ncbi:MAG: redox-sensitive bicupin YhaK (pirin superfamily) [Parasphingorhabdus sp.]|jgi:redox-sensitive bicupin YhaK (pirin superfamily)